MNVSSLAGTNALPGLAPYSASKAGLSHFTAALRAELKGTPITTTLAEIGPVESTMIESRARAQPTGARAARTARTLHLSFDLDMAVVVGALADAIEHDAATCACRSATRLFPMIVEMPRRLTELLLAGVR